jgi:hypothetical protein
MLAAEKSICRVVKLAGGCSHYCIRAAVHSPMQAANPSTVSGAYPASSRAQPTQYASVFTFLDCRQASKT